jgi:DNA-binding GntR family transcriptional regulator
MLIKRLGCEFVNNSIHIEQVDLVSMVYDKIKELILNGKLKPNTKLRQEQIATMLGVSRTPVIKAFQLLHVDCLLEYVPRKGYYVKALGCEEMLNLYYLRGAIESVVSRELAGKLSQDQIKDLRRLMEGFDSEWTEEKRKHYLEIDRIFHTELIKMSKNPFVIRIPHLINLYFASNQHGLMRDFNESLQEHQAILDAIETGNKELAMRLAFEHPLKSATFIEKLFNKN